MAASFFSHPQSVWLRRALFQVHLWVGIAIGLYVVALSATGSVLVYRRELDKALAPVIIMVHPSGPRLTTAQLIRAAQAARPRMHVTRIELHGARVPGAAEEVWYIAGGRRLERLFDPYTGRDLGDTLAFEPAAIVKIADLHDNLLGGAVGQRLNGFGALLLTLVCLSGAIVWWPGNSRWRRSLRVHRGIGWRRFTWELHSMMGFWTLLLLLLWAVTAVYFAFPRFIDTLIGDSALTTAHPGVAQAAETALEWSVRLHFGRGFGPYMQAAWALMGLVPAALFVTGVLMWWNRVLRRAFAPSANGAVRGVISLGPASADSDGVVPALLQSQALGDL